MHYRPTVQLGEGLYHIFEILNCFVDRQGSMGILVFEEGASADVLENQIDKVSLFKEPVEFHYFRVVEGSLKPNFLSELIDHLVLLYLPLFDLFQCKDGVGLDMAGHVNLPELTLAHFCHQSEAIH